MPKLVSEDKASGTQTLWHDLDGAVVLENRQDAAPVTEAARAAFALVDERARFGEFTRVASIPLVTYFDLVKRGITKDRAAFKRWLNDPDNRHFRTRPGRI